MKKCKNFERCQNMIDDKYVYCKDCVDNYKKDDINKEQGVTNDTTQHQLLNKVEDLIVLTKMQNWNLGTIAKVLKFFLIIELEKKGKRTENQEKIYEFLIQYLDKDLKAVKDIKKEEEK